MSQKSEWFYYLSIKLIHTNILNLHFCSMIIDFVVSPAEDQRSSNSIKKCLNSFSVLAWCLLGVFCGLCSVEWMYRCQIWMLSTTEQWCGTRKAHTLHNETCTYWKHTIYSSVTCQLILRNCVSWKFHIFFNGSWKKKAAEMLVTAPSGLHVFLDCSNYYCQLIICTC